MNCIGVSHDAMVAGIGGLYQLTQLNPDFHILADSGFCDVDGILKTTEKFLTQIEEEYLQGSDYQLASHSLLAYKGQIIPYLAL